MIRRSTSSSAPNSWAVMVVTRGGGAEVCPRAAVRTWCGTRHGTVEPGLRIDALLVGGVDAPVSTGGPLPDEADVRP